MPDQEMLRNVSLHLIQSLEGSECVFRSIGFLDDLISIQEECQTDRTCRRIVHRTFDTCFRWLTQPRSRADLEVLGASKCLCSSTSILQELRVHARGQDIAQEIDRAAAPICTLFILILRPFGIRDPSFNAMELKMLHMIPTRRVWPRSMSSMLPHGPENTIHALIQLFRLHLNSGAKSQLYSALELIFHLCHPVIVPYFVASPLFLSHGVIAFFETRPSISTYPPDNAEIHCSGPFMLALSTFTSFMFFLTRCGMTNTQRIAFNSQQPLALLRAYVGFIHFCYNIKLLIPRNHHLYTKYHITTQRTEDAIKQLIHLAGTTYADFPISISTMTTRTVNLKDVICHMATSVQSIHLRFGLVMQHFEIGQRCAAPGCTRTRVDGRLKRCSGCCRVPYCSRACQKFAWRHAISHREVCTSISGLCATYGIPQHGVFNHVMKILYTGKPLSQWTIHEPAARSVVTHFDKLTTTAPCTWALLLSPLNLSDERRCVAVRTSGTP
jgi:hypothetical protein